MAAATQIEQVVQRGWRRRLLVLAIDQSAIALAAIFAAVALLIVLGTQILAWPWLLAVAVTGIGLSAMGVRKRLTDSYSVAQMMDRRLALNDSLSTAWFLGNGGRTKDASVSDFQLQYAERLALNADPAVAFPFERTRAWMATGSLCVLALGLFCVRYVVTRDLSLQHAFLPLSVVQVAERVTHMDAKDSQAEHMPRMAEKLPGTPAAPASPAVERGPEANKPGQPANQEQALKAEGGSPDGKSGTSSSHDQAKDGGGQEDKSKQAGTGEGQKGAAPPGGKENAGDKNAQEAKQQEGAGSQHPENMMSRMRDALSSVMAKIKPSGKPDEQQGSQRDAAGKKSSDQSDAKNQSGDDAKKEGGKEQSATEQSSGQQQGQGAAKAQASGKDSSQSSDKNGSDAQSGVGHADGGKDVQAAEQAKAMGKLAEIIGKRSATLTGEMHVEPSGKQGLQTAFTNQQAQHADLGGEISRDEVPVEDQEYVREYMELVRKDAGRKRAQKSTTSH